MSQEIQASAQAPLLQPNGDSNQPQRKRAIIIATASAAAVIVLAIVLAIGIFICKNDFKKHLPSSNFAPQRNGGGPDVPDLQAEDPNRPHYHVMPKHGWLNDPNGLIYLNGLYHAFFQYNPYSPHWNWSIHWGHAASSDLVHWELLPPALSPSKDGADCGGCWSGSMTLSKEGVPTIIYTGVAQDNSDCYVPLSQRNWVYNPYDGYRETVMWAQPDLTTNNEYLIDWPTRGILVEGPPDGMRLLGWRDPFMYQRAGVADTDGDYILVVGTGRASSDMKTNYGGALMAYSSPNINIEGGAEWTFEGFMLEGTPEDAVMWECPWLVEITPQVGSSNHTHVVSVGGSLWQQTHPTEPLNPVIFWLGHFNESTFKFERAEDTYSKIDLGETFYASNRMIDGNGRVLIWGWLRECMDVNDPRCAHHDYAGSLSIPRVLRVEGNTLRQDVPQEMKQLREISIGEIKQATVNFDQIITLFSGAFHHYEAEVEFHRSSSSASGVMLARSGFSMLIVYAWDSQEIRCYKGTSEDIQTLDPLNAETTEMENYGGILQNMEGVSNLTINVFVDGSSVEVFTSSGQVLSLRLYFNEVAVNPAETVQIVSYYGETIVASANAWMMNSIWKNTKLGLELQNRALKSFPF